MSAPTTSVLWNRCLLASLAVNGVGVGALGVSHFAHPDSGPAQKVASVAKKPKTRLMEIRLEKEVDSKKESPLGKGGGETKDGTDRGGSGDGASDRSDTSSAGPKARAAKSAQASNHGKAMGSKAVPNIDFGHIALAKPKPRTVHSPNGVFDLRNAHIKGTTYADPKLLAKNQSPNKLIGKSEVKVIGKATSMAKCVGSVGGNTIYGGKATILLGKGIDIKGTKFCAPGGIPGVPGSAQGQSGSNASLVSSLWRSSGTGPKAEVSAPKGSDKAKGGSGLNAVDGAAAGDPQGRSPVRATGPVRNVDEPWVSYGYRGGGKRMGGPATDLHLPASHDDPTDRVRPEKSRGEVKPVVYSRFEPAPISVGSHSDRGTIPWGPDSRKRRPQGLRGDYYLGNEFEQYAFTRVDRNIDFVWTNRVVDPRLTRFRPFSVRWTGFVKPDFSETYTIYTSSDDGVRLWIDGKLVIDNWTEHAPQENVAQVSLVAGKEVPIRLEYFEIDGLQIQVIKLYWESPSQPKAYIPARSLFQPGR
jgi:hypothetical protein